MLCRICIKGLDPDQFPEQIAWRVQYFVEKLYNFYADRGMWKELEDDEEYQFHKTVQVF